MSDARVADFGHSRRHVVASIVSVRLRLLCSCPPLSKARAIVLMTRQSQLCPFIRSLRDSRAARYGHAFQLLKDELRRGVILCVCDIDLCRRQNV